MHQSPPQNQNTSIAETGASSHYIRPQDSHLKTGKPKTGIPWACQTATSCNQPIKGATSTKHNYQEQHERHIFYRDARTAHSFQLANFVIRAAIQQTRGRCDQRQHTTTAITPPVFGAFPYKTREPTNATVHIKPATAHIKQTKFRP
jgi:hypothetical protein